MPYIEKELRPIMDRVVDLMSDLDVEPNGQINYILYLFCKRYVPKRYNALKNYCAELRACATEIERTILGPYEDEKIEENGDII